MSDMIRTAAQKAAVSVSAVDEIEQFVEMLISI